MPIEASATEYSLTQAAQRESSGYRRIGLGALLGLSALVLLLLPQQLSLAVAYRTADLMAAEPEPVAGRDGVIDFKKRPQDEVAEMAYVILIRHGEKGSKGEADYNGLSPTGMKRAEYLARCMSSPLSSLALPAGPPKYLLASHTKPDKSHRAIDTAMPLAQRLGLKVHDQIHVSHRTRWFACRLATAQLLELARAVQHRCFRSDAPLSITAPGLRPSPRADQGLHLLLGGGPFFSEASSRHHGGGVASRRDPGPDRGAARPDGMGPPVAETVRPSAPPAARISPLPASHLQHPAARRWGLPAIALSVHPHCRARLWPVAWPVPFPFPTGGLRFRLQVADGMQRGIVEGARRP